MNASIVIRGKLKYSKQHSDKLSMDMPRDLPDVEIRELLGGPIQQAYELCVKNPDPDQGLEFCTLFPERQPYGQLLVDYIKLETGELTIFAIHQLPAECVLTTRRLIWRNDLCTIQSVRLNNIKDVGLLADRGDPAYPADHYHYLQARVLKEGSPAVGANSKECDLNSNSQCLYLIDGDGARHVVYLVKRFPLQTVIASLRSVSAQEVHSHSLTTPAAKNNKQTHCNRACKLQYWFETHGQKVNDKTLYYRNLDNRRKELIASKIALPDDNEIVICSFFDDNNFLLVGDKYLVWHSDTDGGSVPLQNVEVFHRKGDLGDDRYGERKTRHYHDGAVKEQEEIDPKTKLPSYFVCDASPMVFIKELGGRYYDFKVEPGRQIDTIWVGIVNAKHFLAAEQ